MKKAEKALRIVKAIDKLIECGFELAATEWQECDCGLDGCGFFAPTRQTQGFYTELKKLNDARSRLALYERAKWIDG